MGLDSNCTRTWNLKKKIGFLSCDSLTENQAVVGVNGKTGFSLFSKAPVLLLAVNKCLESDSGLRPQVTSLGYDGADLYLGHPAHLHRPVCDSGYSVPNGV